MEAKKNIEYVSNYITSFDSVSQYFEYYDKKYLEAIKRHDEILLTNVLQNILNYCKINAVKIVEFDDVKICYFLGKELAKLENDSNYMLVMVDILNLLTKHKTSKNTSEDMVKKIKKHITEDTWSKEYGIHGIYAIFKTVIKSCGK